MAGKRNPPTPSIDEVRVRFEQWRQTRQGRARIPEELWAAAVGLARRNGVNRTAAALHLDGGKLKRELSGGVRTLFLLEIGQAKIRRTDVRPIFNRRAISDLLMPARCSFRISAACTAAVAGRPNRFPFSRA